MTWKYDDNENYVDMNNKIQKDWNLCKLSDNDNYTNWNIKNIQ